MQTLYFEDAWDRTIAPSDRQLIEERFTQSAFHDGVHFTYIREATNHQKENLVTVIIHNCNDTHLTIEDICIAYEGEEKQWLHQFHLPLSINPRTSMPWTFIFPHQSLSDCMPIYTITASK